MKALKVTKYQLNSFKRGTSIFYAIFIFVCCFLAYAGRNGNATSSGLEFSTAIFVFVVGLNIFKESFYFLKANNVSRKDYLIGTALSLISFSAILSIIDIILNRLYNIFIDSPMFYEMAFGSYNKLNNGTLGIGSYDKINNVIWSQGTDILTLLGSFLMQWGLCLLAVSLGLLINLIYYRSNKPLKLIVSISPAIVIILINFISKIAPNILKEIGEIWIKVFERQTNNVYTLFISLIIGFLIEISLSYLLVRRAIIKE